MYENRRHLRIREITDVRWTILGTEVLGEGKVLNISSSGLLLQTDTQFNLLHSGLLYIDAHDEAPLEFGPKKGKVVWTKRLFEGQKGFQCGVAFVKSAAQDRKLERWIDGKTEELTRTTDVNILDHYIH